MALRLRAAPSIVSAQTDPLEGRYANFFKVGYNSFEFVLDFGQVYSDAPSETIYHTRIVTSPAYAGVFLELLQDSIEKYQKTFGPIAKPPGSEDMDRPQ